MTQRRVENTRVYFWSPKFGRFRLYRLMVGAKIRDPRGSHNKLNVMSHYDINYYLKIKSGIRPIQRNLPVAVLKSA